MTARSELTQALLSALRELDGLRPAAPRDLGALAVGVDDDLVEIRLVALALPLPPLLRKAEASLRSIVDASPFRGARLRLLVTDLDAAALKERDLGHMIGP
ncbi:hypothetical protein SAMN05421504_1011094 [Amycolatopsis xylanica]|uniref:Uncharacterized protein n=1 Tax=Amycolatopsis xylanica TaxID=589385 RepID=A0A1H2V3F4_9PSEU|nr:hypothetical protein [Amycolatopsis xylanica]SDW62872.1 hypothetical protein SAMN05421504_1011094 [Amycolatopsis xylanica]